jgi:hypothetical protein
MMSGLEEQGLRSSALSLCVARGLLVIGRGRVGLCYDGILRGLAK